MTYGYSTAAFAPDAPVERALVRSAGIWGGYPAWRRLDDTRRLELIAAMLKPANDLIDEFPLAL